MYLLSSLDCCNGFDDLETIMILQDAPALWMHSRSTAWCSGSLAPPPLMSASCACSLAAASSLP